MQLTVKSLSATAVPVFFERLGPLAGKLLEKIFGKADQNAVVPNDTKEALKDFVLKLVEGFVAAAPLPPALKFVLTQIVSRLDGVLFDLIWNALFQKGQVTVALPMTASPDASDIAPLDIPAEAAGAFFAEYGEAIPGSGY